MMRFFGKQVTFGDIYSSIQSVCISTKIKNKNVLYISLPEAGRVSEGGERPTGDEKPIPKK